MPVFSKPDPVAKASQAVEKAEARAAESDASAEQAHAEYLAALARGADPESSEATKAHRAWSDALAKAERAADAVNTAQEAYADALGTANREAARERWAQVEGLAKARTAAAVEFSTAAQHLAETRRRLEQTASDLFNALPVTRTGERWRPLGMAATAEQITGELQRTRVIARRVGGLPDPKPLADLAADCESMVAQFRRESEGTP